MFELPKPSSNDVLYFLHSLSKDIHNQMLPELAPIKVVSLSGNIWYDLRLLAINRVAKTTSLVKCVTSSKCIASVNMQKKYEHTYLSIL